MTAIFAHRCVPTSIPRTQGASILDGVMDRYTGDNILSLAGDTLQEISRKTALPYSVTKRRHPSALKKLRAAMEGAAAGSIE